MSKTTIPRGGITADAIDATLIADDAISDEHLDITAITGQTALAATPADTDEFLINDGGTLKRIDASYVGGQDMVLITSGGFPDSGDTVNFSNQFDNSTYNMFILYFADVYANGANKITVQLETGGNGTYLTGSDYSRVNHGRDDAGNSSNSEATGATYVNIQSTNANQSNWASRSGHIVFNRPGQVAARKTFHGQISYFSTDSNSPLTIEQFAGRHSDGSNAVTGFRLVASTSTFEGGSYHLFGLKAS